MFSATLIAEYVNQLHIQNMFKKIDGKKLKDDRKCFLEGAKHGQKCVASLVREL